MKLCVRGLTFSWERHAPPAVEKLSLELEPGGLTVVVGPNGSGKSTLLALLAGLLPPREGEVLLDGISMARIPPRRRARWLAYLPQQVTPLYDLTVRELVTTGRYPWGTPWAGADPDGEGAVARALDATDTGHLAPRRFGALSGGERQRCLVAAVLAQETQWLLLDEPTVSLDLHHAVDVFRVLRRTAGKGRGVLTVTHDLNLAALFADRVILLSGGHKRAEGPVERVFSQEELEAVYGPGLTVLRHPATGRPAVLPGKGDAP